MLTFAYQRLPLVPFAPAPAASWAMRLFHLVTGKSDPAQTPEEVKSEPAQSRPFVPVRIRGLVKSRRFRLALIDTGSVVTVFPAETASLIGVTLGGAEQTLRWRGRTFAIEYQTVELELQADRTLWRWRASVGFSEAPLAYPLLGLQGFLEYMDARFRGADQVMELETNRRFPGSVIV